MSVTPAEVRAAFDTPTSDTFSDSTLVSPSFHLGVLGVLVAQSGDAVHHLALNVIREALDDLQRTKADLRWLEVWGDTPRPSDPVPLDLADRSIAAMRAALTEGGQS